MQRSKYIKPIKILLFALLLGSILMSCFEDMDDIITEAGTVEINEFIWKGMNNIYLYKADVPDLADDRFATQKELNSFLSRFSSPENLFYDGLLAPQDEFSFLVDDYIKLEQALDGISVSNGMQFGLSRYPGTSEKVFGYVRYVLPNTSAETQGIERGDIFNSIDGQQLTLDNYSRLLEPDSYTIGLAEIIENDIIPTGETISLRKQEYTSNPVFLTKTFETTNGRAGYLLYNGFTGTFDSELNNAFATFKTEGVTNLILDLRYNSGGSVETAVDLASMVTGQFEGEVFATQQWNEEYQTYFEENHPARLSNLFNSSLRTGEKINSLGLEKLYVITTLRTASASELVINGLDPYINVIQVGDTTTGKFQASITLYDSDDFKRRGANPGHTYAIQPLVYKSLNAAGKTDFFNGLAPDIELKEDVRNLGILGDPDEPLLKAALNDIEGVGQKIKSPASPYKTIEENGMQEILFQKMYAEEIPPLIKAL